MNSQPDLGFPVSPLSLSLDSLSSCSLSRSRAKFTMDCGSRPPQSQSSGVRVVAKFVAETHGSNGDPARMCVSFSDDGHALVSTCPCLGDEDVDDVIPVSAKYGHGIDNGRDWILLKLPFGPAYYPKVKGTDRGVKLSKEEHQEVSDVALQLAKFCVDAPVKCPLIFGVSCVSGLSNGKGATFCPKKIANIFSTYTTEWDVIYCSVPTSPGGGYRTNWVPDSKNIFLKKDCYEVYALVPGLLREEIHQPRSVPFIPFWWVM